MANGPNIFQMLLVMQAYEVQIYYAVCGVLQRQLELAVHEGHFDLIQRKPFWQRCTLTRLS